MKPANESSPAVPHPALAENIALACRRIAPLFPLKNFVAVNPFVGLADRHFAEAVRLLPRVGHGDMLMPADYYRDQLAAGRIRATDVQAALEEAGQILPPAGGNPLQRDGLEQLRQHLALDASAGAAPRVLAFADYLDAQTGSAWASLVVEEMSKWFSAYYDEGQSSWRMPWRQLHLFAAWREAARLDANPELAGLKEFRPFVAALPASHREVIAQALAGLGVPLQQQPDFLHRQLLSLTGWSSYVQYRVREQGMAGQADDSLNELLAIRLAYDLALFRCFGTNATLLSGWQHHLAGLSNDPDRLTPGLRARFVAQLALEHRYQSDLQSHLRSPRASLPAAGQKSLQAVFCIDVRSEVFRRALEAQSAAIETLGFAGFFGMPFEFVKFGELAGAAQCPVLLTPKIRVRESLVSGDALAEARLLRRLNFRETVHSAWNSFKTSAISCFSFVETAGLLYGVKLLRDSWAFAAPVSPGAGTSAGFFPKIAPESAPTGKPGNAENTAATGIPSADQINLAAGALKNMGLTSGFAKVVLICGHGGASANNPYAAALDCGACGGHAGDANARVAAAILNQPAVRAGLSERGIHIPKATVFIAGLHNTTTDDVTLYDLETLTTEQLAEVGPIKTWLAGATAQARQERASSLGLGTVPTAALAAHIHARSRDWSQVRPEWGLAGNAAFIAAPRARTQGLNLGGRVFLHNYEAAHDPDNAILEMILSAPVVVASWINLQYYGSTVNNRLFGSGNKVLHNVVGTFGIWQGNGGDLQAGLPLQSLHDGTQWRHEPLRLSVYVEAEPAALEAVLARQPGVRQLVEHGWIHLFAMDAVGDRFWRRTREAFVAEPPIHQP